MANNSISLVNLDFDTLKANLKTYLKAQPQFSDYDFDGSNMSVLLDILSYNTHLNAFYLNMAVSEMFLDSAQLRNSVISRAKELNYVPRSAKSSQAQINISFPQSNLSVFSIPFGTKFSGKSSNGTFQYATDRSYVLYPSGGRFQANLTIYEGSNFSDAFVVDDSIEAQRFILSNDGIDTDSLTVLLSENDGQSNTLLQRADTLYGLTPNSAVYFLQATEDTRYEIVFGDGILGRKPLNNSVIFADYRVTSGAVADGSTNFTLDDNLGPINGVGSISPTITVLAPGSGGAEAETIESIRFNAPRHYQTQDRAITTSDYKNLILNNFTEVKAVNVFGGDQTTGSVEYGRVFCSPVTFSGAPLSEIEKQNIQTFLSDKCTLGITPVVIDPDYIYLLITTKVKYDAASTVNTAADIQALAAAAIDAFNADSLTKFDTEFKLSRLDTAINSADPSISSNETTVSIRKNVNVDLNNLTYIDVNYRNPIQPGTFSSSAFLSGSKKYQYTDFNPSNNTLTVRQLPNGKIEVTNSSTTVYLKDITLPGYESYSAAGQIDYQKGTIALNQITVTGFVDTTSIEFYAACQNQDIRASGNDLIQIDMQKLNITAVAV